MKLFKLILFHVTLLFSHSLLFSQPFNNIPNYKVFIEGNDKVFLSQPTVISDTSLSSNYNALIDAFIDTIKMRTKNQSFLAEKDAASSIIYFRALREESIIKNFKNGYFKIIAKHKQVEVVFQDVIGLNAAICAMLFHISESESKSYIPELEIVDYPSFNYRGIMMDFAEGGLLKVDEIKQQIDFLANWGINQYYFYSEISIDLDSIYISKSNGYTKEEVQIIIDYAEVKGIDVIPIINFYGHLHSLLMTEFYCKLGVGQYGHELDPNNSDVKKLTTEWINQYSRLFKSEYFHIGFDEIWETRRLSFKKTAKIQWEEYFVTHLNSICSQLKRHNKKVMLWTDMTKFQPKLIEAYPKEVIPVVWEYSEDSIKIDTWIKPVVNKFKSFFIQSAIDGWSNLYPTQKSFNNTKYCIEAGVKYNASGMINSLWTDAVEPLTRSSWLFMAYSSYAAWSGKAPNPNNFINFFSKKCFPKASKEVTVALNSLGDAQDSFSKFLGDKTDGSIVESWSNPFQPRYYKRSTENIQHLKSVRLMCEIAEKNIMEAMRKEPYYHTHLNSLLATCKLLHYKATRFLWAKLIIDRWNEGVNSDSMRFLYTVYYDILNTANGLIADIKEDIGEIKNLYSLAWDSEFKPYKKNSVLMKFDYEFNCWQRLNLQMINQQVSLEDNIRPASFYELFSAAFE
jgi:hexosaminidase